MISHLASVSRPSTGKGDRFQTVLCEYPFTGVQSNRDEANAMASLKKYPLWVEFEVRK
jgi:hypothetical protein